MADDLSVPPLPAGTDTRVFPVPAAIEDQQDVAKAEKALERVKVVAVAVDDERGRAVVLTKNQISASTKKILPEYLEGVPVEYIGHAGIEPNPPVLPQAAVDAAERLFVHNDRIACGSSLSAASVWGAGTLGALVTLGDGTLCGLTNNHVTGACNHTRVGMHILSPAPFDADPDHRAPTAIGRHHSFVALASGDPRQVQLQELDVALFDLTNPDLVTSMQGSGLYDTPEDVADPIGGMAVKKVGRTTGLTYGEIIGRFSTPLGIPYTADRFKSTVYFQNSWAIRATDGGPFSMGGDSGSLVVTGDGAHAVGLIFAGATDGSISYMIPIRSVLRGLGASLLRGHNV
ncbi:hypothetical protein [Sphingomonas solaris]|uniref:Trypsin-like peptidase domain-containing protein n=1 Tax=Alterirhizorhabdus solaris TaxID=2529389 RepID=A0A558R5N6_9SPHN|nr:hypothetical protein [Sphingomonas solaris]TVV74695.1 hypothetical protein FOY91_09010 [Sphingomonas solaris]